MHDQGLPIKVSPTTNDFPTGSTSFPKIIIPGESDLLWVRKDVTCFRFPGLSLNQQLIHGVFTRMGGLSDPPYNGLNTSYTVGDSAENVNENLSSIKKAVEAEHLIFVDQVHGDSVFVIRRDHLDTQGEIPPADAMITDISCVALMIKQADCQGVIIFDPKRSVVANVHCGWRGNVQNILGRVIARMKHDFECRPSDLVAAIGPSLGPCCAEFVTHEEIFPENFRPFMVRENYFDLWAVSCGQLVEAGLKEENIEVSGICTRCRTDLFYSYRAEGKTGRFATVAMLC
ncbi:MAG: peptidoglycan editing factor PgeF [Desulfobacterales bacterium]|nr:peptidoglycan editing factor PgeF [Desulfobacterales bacterium]